MNRLLQLPWLLVGISACCNCAGTLLLKQSRLMANHPSVWAAIASPWFAAAVMVYGTGLLMFSKALGSLPVSAAIPFSTGLGFILITILSHWLFDEQLTTTQLMGATLIVTGIAVITR